MKSSRAETGLIDPSYQSRVIKIFVLFVEHKGTTAKNASGYGSKGGKKEDTQTVNEQAGFLEARFIMERAGLTAPLIPLRTPIRNGQVP